MIISVNSNTNKADFDALLSSTTAQLNRDAKQKGKEISKLSGRSLEPYVKSLMSELAVGSPFENTIELIGGQKFPDIVAKRFFGIEVKTTTQNHWKSTGNSVLESTRVEDVERIFLLFAKLASPIEFRSRPYEDVLSEVVVTHSPRYLIDMNLEKGATIFDKIQTPYDSLRRLENPIRPIVDYYKSKLKPGEELWWMDSDSSGNSSSIIIRIWNNLSKGERRVLKTRAMVYFPELFGRKANKFNRLAIWLATREAVVCPNVRDLFTAGGRINIKVGDEVFKDLPRVYLNLFESTAEIAEIINQASSQDLTEYWGKFTSEESKLFDWIQLVCNQASDVQNSNHKKLEKVLNRLFW